MHYDTCLLCAQHMRVQKAVQVRQSVTW